MELITTHVNTDFDGLAAMVAAMLLYPGAVAAFPGAQEKNVREFVQSPAWLFDVKKHRDVDPSAVTRLIVVDTRDASRLGPFAELAGKPGIDIHVFDHHPPRNGDIRGSFELVDEAGCMSARMVELLVERGVDIPSPAATVLALGIYEETGFFTFPNIGPREFLAMAKLMERGANLNVVNCFLGREPSPEQIDLLNELLQSSTEMIVGGFVVRLARASRDRYIPDAAMVAHKFRDITECDAMFILLRMEDRIHIIGRSNVPEVNSSDILSHFGGGGHPYAASASLDAFSLEETEERLAALIRQTVHPGKTAADVMTSPVKAIADGITMSEARDVFTRYGFNVMPVLCDDKFSGVISRDVVELALRHGFGDRAVSEFATTDPASASSETPMSEVEAMMVERNRKFIPVVDDCRVVGAITRTDLLRVLYEGLIRRTRMNGEPAVDHAAAPRNLSVLMREKFPANVYALLRLCGDTAAEMGFNAYLVGGSVRDLLRGERNLDLDIVVEGHGIRFAEALAAKTGARVRGHERFNTAAVVMPDGFKLDVATSRTEYYESPAVLPAVEASSIKKDLYRRDFTINTLAVKLNTPDFGALHDFFGGARDIKDKTIRILHNLSFVEDPTRAFRAIRFAGRFGFRMGKHTANLMRAAARMNLFDRLSGSRLHDELMLLFREASPANAVNALNAYGLLASIHPELKLTPALTALLERLEKVCEWHRLLYRKERLNEGTVCLMAMISGMKTADAVAAITRLNVPPKTASIIRASLGQGRIALNRLKDAEPRNIYYALRGFRLEALVFAMAKTQDEEQRRAISHYITELRETVPLLSGKELLAMGFPPGPLYQEILRSLLDARLRGLVKTRYDETQYVRSRFADRIARA